MKLIRKLEAPTISTPFTVRKLIFRIIIIWDLSDLFSHIYSHISNYSKNKEKLSHQDKITNVFSDNVCKGASDWTWEKLKFNNKTFTFRWKLFKAPFNIWLFFKANRSFTDEGYRYFCTVPVQNPDLQILTLEAHISQLMALLLMLRREKDIVPFCHYVCSECHRGHMHQDGTLQWEGKQLMLYKFLEFL